MRMRWSDNLLSSLDDSDYADNTIVIIWSDHGWQLGEKQHWRKFALWENVIRTVLMIKAPKGISKAPDGTFPGQTANTLTSLVDIYPTLLDLCSIPQRDHCKRTVKYTLQFLFSFLLDSGCFHFLFYPEVRQ